MSKKNFSGGLNSLLGEGQEKKKLGRPQTATRIPTKSTQEGLNENEDRATFIVNMDLLDRIKAIAYWKRLRIKDTVNEAFSQYIERYEKENGPLPMPKK